MEITVIPKKEIAQKTGDKISKLFNQHKNVPILFLVSGGSAFEVYDTIKTDDLSSHITVAVLDERFNLDESINNFKQLTKTEFYKSAQGHNTHFINTYPLEKETFEEFSTSFEGELKKWKQENKEGIVIAVVGIGIDGHISGMMPIPENKIIFDTLFENSHWVVGYDTQDRIPFRYRTTTTMTFLRSEIDHTIVYISDEKKKDILKKALQKDKPLHEIPGRIINEMKDVELFTVIDLQG